MTGSSRPFSTASIRIVADELTSTSSPSVEAVLQKLLRIDGQIDADFKSLKQDLSQAQHEISEARSELQREADRRTELQRHVMARDATIASLRKELKLVNVKHQSVVQKKPLTPRRNNSSASNRSRPDKKSLGLCKCETAKENLDGVSATDHEPDCALKKAVLAEMDPNSLCDILTAREEAYRAQSVLVERLKSDNKELKDTYEKLRERYQAAQQDRPSEESSRRISADERIQHLSFRVQQAGEAACVVADHIESRLHVSKREAHSIRSTFGQSPDGITEVTHLAAQEQSSFVTSGSKKGQTGSSTVIDEYENDSLSTELECVRKENERFDAAGKELLRTLALQQKAHDCLRGTVLELTKELERIEPQKIEEMKKCRKEVDSAHKQITAMSDQLKKTKSELKDKSKDIASLKKQLKKVLAEYEAVSIAHSYSNAELSKIRAKTRYDRQTNDRPPLRGNANNHAVDNLLHHRRNHFR